MNAQLNQAATANIDAHAAINSLLEQALANISNPIDRALAREAAPVFIPASKAKYIVLDIETGDAPEDAIAAAGENWKAPANVKDPAKIEARQIKAADKIRDKGALLDASPILCAVLVTDSRGLVFDGTGASHGVESFHTTHAKDERGMLLNLRAFLDSHASPETVIVGHRVKKFDLPKLRNAYLRHKLRLPEILKPRGRNELRAEIIDTAELFHYFSMEHADNLFVSLDTVCTTLGIPRPKSVISGADVPKLHRAGRDVEILTYCAIDTAATAQAYLLMTGQAEDLQ